MKIIPGTIAACCLLYGISAMPAVKNNAVAARKPAASAPAAYKKEPVGKADLEKAETAGKPEDPVEKAVPEEKPKEDAPPDKALLLRYQRDLEMSKIRRLFLGGRTAELERSLKAFSARFSLERDREYYFYLGFVYEAGGEYRKAVESYRTAIDISPDYARARNSLGNLYCRLHKYHFALVHFQKALEINPYNPFLQYNLGNLYYDIGDLDSAKIHLENSIKYKANFGSAYHKLGVLLFHKKQYVATIENLSRAMDFKNESHITHFYIGLSYYNLEKGSLAMASLKKALAIKPDFFEGACELGNIYHSYGEFSTALEYYKKAEALNPDSRALKLSMVECYRELKRNKEGIAVVRQLLERDPENEQLKKYLKNLQDRKLIENLAEPYDYYTY